MVKPAIIVSIILISMTWMITTLILLIFSFSYLDSVNVTINGLINLKIIVIAITALLSVVSIYITGSFIDYHPHLLRSITIISFISTILALAMIEVIPQLGFSGTIGFLLLGPSLGCLTGVTNSNYGSYCPVKYRGRVYGIAISSFALSSVGIIGYHSIISLPGFEIIKSLTALLAVILLFVVAFILIIYTKKITPWTNDEWPTSWKDILTRSSLQRYLLMHFMLYCMIGIVIQNITITGQNITPIISNLRNTDLFWALVFLGDGLMAIPSGFLSDYFGRKTVGTFGIYGVALSLLFYALDIQSPIFFMLSAFLFGSMLSLIHTTFDSTIWVDLSPRDAIGRYYALGFSTLILGIGMGYASGAFINAYITFISTESIAFILIFVALISAFPLFSVSDTYKPLDFQLLLLIRAGGLMCFNYQFQTTLKTSVNLNLLSGALEAVSNFMKETIHEANASLNLVQYGHMFIIIERQLDTSAALIVNKTSIEVHSRLSRFLKAFNSTYAEDLHDWNGDLRPFKTADHLVEEIFGPLIPTFDLNDNN